MKKILIQVPASRPRNEAAKALASGLYQPKTIPNRKAYDRKRDKKVTQ